MALFVPRVIRKKSEPMKTLDEVIKAFEQCKGDKCYECAYHEKVHANSCIAKRNSDALYYLKKYRDNFEARNNQVERYQKAAKDCEEILTDYVALKQYWAEQQANNPLTWDELKQMEGRPVWVEWTKTEESYWCFVGEWFDDDEMRIYHIGRDYADYIHKTVYIPDIVQAYRKERS